MLRTQLHRYELNLYFLAKFQIGAKTWLWQMSDFDRRFRLQELRIWREMAVCNSYTQVSVTKRFRIVNPPAESNERTHYEKKLNYYWTYIHRSHRGFRLEP